MRKLLALSTVAALFATATTAEARDPYGYGYGGGYNYNITGAQPGSGPYDSRIATTGISAAAGVITALIMSQRPPTTVVVNQPDPGYRSMPGATTGTLMSPRCFDRQYGRDMQGYPLFEKVCR